jgi:hypothetical protein
LELCFSTSTKRSDMKPSSQGLRLVQFKEPEMERSG